MTLVASFGPDLPIGFRASDAPTTGFRGCTLSLTASQPGDVDALVDAALAAADVAATKRFYLEHGLTVARSFGKKYVEFDSGPSSLKLALYGRRALAKDAGVPVDGSGSHRIVLGDGAASFTDPDGFPWEADAD